MSVEVKLIVIPSDTEPKDILDVSVYGKNLSTAETIIVNKAKFGYTVIYSEEDFVTMRMSVLVNSLVKLFKANVPNEAIMFSIMHELNIDGTDTPDITATTRQLFILHGIFHDLVNRKNPDGTKTVPDIYYHTTNQMKDILQIYTYAYGTTAVLGEQRWKARVYDPNGDKDVEDEEDYDFNDESEENEDEDDEYEEDGEYDEEPDLFEQLMNPRPSKKKSKEKEYYGRSRVWKNAKNPKRDINRHGVVISSDKDDIKRDEKIIKSFLKDFIPGSAGWKKEFRAELVKRWISVYTVSKKNLKSLEKKYRRSVIGKRKSKEAKDVLRFANKLFTVPVDRWNDPSK